MKKIFLSICLAVSAQAALAQSTLTPWESAPPLPIVDGVAPVTPENTKKLPSGNALAVSLSPDKTRVNKSIVGPKDDSPEAGLIRRLYRQGRAAGLAGVLYDNRDRKHSNLGDDIFPQISRTEYAEPFKRSGLDYSIGGRLIFSLPTFGNSSTVLRGPGIARSLGRAGSTSQQTAMSAYRLYRSNHIYVYPEHRDHDSEAGDKFSAITPYQIVSQGSSGSDRPFLRAIGLAIAGLTPDTRNRLEAERLLAPTVQMLLRRTMRGINSRDDYLSGRAHRSAYDGKDIRPAALVTLANSLSPEMIPPMVQLRVTRDFQAVPGRDYLARNLDEALFTTPSAIGRTWRSYDYRREIEVSVADTRDPNGLPLSFDWVILRGNPEKIRFTYASTRRDRATIRIDWHDAFTTPYDPDMLTNRVDIGIFANNGHVDSAPAILSVAFPLFQDRHYEPTPNGPRLQRIGYAADDQTFLDPLLWPTAKWTDHLNYDDSGRLDRIRRELPNGVTKLFRPGEASLYDISDGTSAQGGTAVTHIAARGNGGSLKLQMSETAESLFPDGPDSDQ
ncbi:hypothetical protein [Qingshengfaniella alkalisoli]|uniref:Uncharacterized protein n=1 Tax=Qingshengfaniella alkalisoli TaxID=2599296 RepID=A0A5B8IUG7_9RHOB|nr:hypothetical protein [Qingshengfaniella alkalisoli]QDY69762.1 hypothetical protein FPZ52_09105 [Qingshengfaniella alkalisoli]